MTHEIARVEYVLGALTLSHIALGGLVLWLWRRDRHDDMSFDREGLVVKLTDEHRDGWHRQQKGATALLCPACQRARWTGTDVGDFVEDEHDKWLRQITGKSRLFDQDS